jgi:hypothetical protein
MSLGIRSRNRAELRNVMRTLPGSECDLEFCIQVLNELRALTGFGSQKAFEDRALEFVEGRLSTITDLAERLATSKSSDLAVLESFQQQKPES